MWEGTVNPLRPVSASPQPEARVLVVDDEEQIRRLVRILVTRLQNKYSLVINEAGSAEQALALCDRQTFELIITDHNMPGKTGVDLLAHAFRRSPATGRMLITALPQADIGVDAVNRGHVDAFMRKPWDNPSFVALVDSLLETRAGRPARPVTAAPPRPAPRATAPPPPRAAPSPQGAPTSAPPRADADLETQLRELDKQLAQLRVRLGLGSISAQAFTQLHRELSSRRATIEARILGLT